jgi:phosphate transport system substrate-binding protein
MAESHWDEDMGMHSNLMKQRHSHNSEKPLGGRYKIIQQLGAGSFSQTFTAEDLHLPNRPRCVIKQLKTQFESDEDWQIARRLFDTEAEVLYKLGNHDQIPHLLAHFEEDQNFYLAQELIVGQPLDQLLAEKPVWTQAEVVALLQDLLGVLAFVHRQGIIHRDIKPSNLIRRQQDGRIVLIDFGAVKQLSLGVSDTKSGKMDLTISIGTQGYAPAEQLAGEPCLSSDVYAVGMVAIRALTGVHPKNLKKDLCTHEEFQWWQQGMSVCPELAIFLNCMVRYDYHERYSTANEALAVLRRISAYLPEDLSESSEPLMRSEPSALTSHNNPVKDNSSPKQSSDKVALRRIGPTEPRSFPRMPIRRSVLLKGLVTVGFAILIVTPLLSSQAVISWLTQHQDSVSSSTQRQASSTPPNSRPASNPSTFARVSDVPSGLFNYGGSTTWAPIRNQVDIVLQAAHPGFQLRYTHPVNATPGSAGVQMLLEGQLAFSQSSRPLEDQEYQQSQLRGYSLRQIPVAIDAIAIAVHPSLSVPGLTLKQLQAIYMGRITNWQQVGGPNLKITPYSRRPADSETVGFFVKNVLGGNGLGNNVQYVYSTTDGLRKVAGDLGGIYYASAPAVVPQCKVKALPIGRESNDFVPPYQEPWIPAEGCSKQKNQLNVNAFKTGEYPITRRLFVIIKQDGHTDQHAGEAYANLLLTNEGQELISKAGFVRVR